LRATPSCTAAMIKRALGVFVDGHVKGGPGSDEDSDDGLTAAQRRKLELRLLPGAATETSRASRQAGRGYTREVDSDSDLGDDDDDDSDNEPPVYESKVEEEPVRGKFRCELCPYKLLLTEKDLELHLNSKMHKKNEARFDHAREIGVEAYEEECRLRAGERERAAGTMSSTKMRNFEYWKKQRERGRKKTRQEIAAKRTDEQKERHYAKWHAKQARRQAKKAAEAEAASQVENSRENGKKRGIAREDAAGLVPSKKKAKAKEAASQVENSRANGEDTAEFVPLKKKVKAKEAASQVESSRANGKEKRGFVQEDTAEFVPSKKKANAKEAASQVDNSRANGKEKSGTIQDDAAESVLSKKKSQ